LLQYQLFSIENGTSDMFVFKFNVGDQYLITRCKINLKKHEANLAEKRVLAD